jgi:pimeloyl-ACP methyl ester carboxylesterase
MNQPRAAPWETASETPLRAEEGSEMAQTGRQTGYAPVNGLQMYYEIHGEGGVPLLLLHGAFSNIETDFSQLLPLLAANRQVIAVEQQAHGRTADFDRPLSYEQMADDTAALLDSLDIDQVDVFGYSFGSATGLELAIRHPELVRKLILAGGASYRPDGLHPQFFEINEHLTADALAANLAGTPWQETYARIAPNPDDWETLVGKKMDLDSNWRGWSDERIQAVAAPVMLMIGDSDIVRPEHVIELFRLLGGGVPGDLTGLPKSQLAILPGTTHVTIMWENVDRLASMAEAFLAAPMPADQ